MKPIRRAVPDGVPREWLGDDRSRRRFLLSSMETDMPNNAPYPGESMEAFMARMSDPAMAMSRLLANPSTNPANTMHMGRTTENYLDAGLPNGGNAPMTAPSDADLQMLLNELLGQGQQLGNNRDPRADALQRMLQERGYSHDVARMRPGAVVGPETDAFDDDGSTSVEGFVTRYGDMPATDSEVEAMYPDYDQEDEDGNPGVGEDWNFRNAEIADEMMGPQGQFRGHDPEKSPSTEDELNMVQGQINKSDVDREITMSYGINGDLQNDLSVLKSLGDDDYDLNGAVQAFIDAHGEDALPEEYQYLLDNPNED